MPTKSMWARARDSGYWKPKQSKQENPKNYLLSNSEELRKAFRGKCIYLLLWRMLAPEYTHLDVRGQFGGIGSCCLHLWGKVFPLPLSAAMLHPPGHVGQRFWEILLSPPHDKLICNCRCAILPLAFRVGSRDHSGSSGSQTYYFHHGAILLALSETFNKIKITLAMWSKRRKL